MAETPSASIASRWNEGRCTAAFKQGELACTCEERAGHEAEFGRTENEHHGYLTGPGWRIAIDWWAES